VSAKWENYDAAVDAVGSTYFADRLVDVRGIDCGLCGALLRADDEVIVRHFDWHRSLVVQAVLR
jgi:hypothetical protein